MGECKRILVTGANGFVGRHLSKLLLASGFGVSKIVRSALPLGCEVGDVHVLDLTDRNKVSDIFSRLQPDYVIHLAGVKNRSCEISQFRNAYDINMLMALNVIDACHLSKNFKRLIFLGSCDEYGAVSAPYNECQKEAPTNAYGLSKLATTQILSGLFYSQQFPSVVLRPTVIYGPGQGDEMFISALIRSLLIENDFLMTSGDQYRDFVYIDDVVDAIIKALHADDLVNGAVINIGAGVSYQIKYVATLVANIIGSGAERHIKFGVINYRQNDVMNYSVMIERANELLGWRPGTDLILGLNQTIRQIKESGGNSECLVQEHG